ncbi:DNA polymerase zeta processivity subunit isoform X2 [Selaginella moellendorffii]|nr:DNA polymerase zeta processivity subunit isoform X2 [Selaginella moellendorffii]|eukprot:XP_002968014.2 DNA polymerase zeta processivity subunit isoform X2 [Selaginella moellendorffii]
MATGPAATLLCEFLEAAVHLLLSIRGLYSPEVFERRRYMNCLIHWARHPGLQQYIHNVVYSLHTWIKQGVVDKIALVVHNKENVAVEKYIFKLQVDLSFEGEFRLNDLEPDLRAFFMKIGASRHLLLPLPPDCSWELVAYSKQMQTTESSGDLAWIPTEIGAWAHPPLITPIKSMKSQFLNVQLYVEQPKV